MAARYPVILEPQPEGAVLVRFPDLSDVVTEGADEAEALAMAADCLDEWVSYLLRRRRPVPPPSPVAPGRPAVTLAALTAAKAALWEAMRSADVPIAELARRLVWQPLQVRRLLDPRHRSRLDRLDEAARALGKALVVELHSAA